MKNFPQRNPVLLVHGLNDTNSIFWKMGNYLTQEGWSVYSLDMIPCNGDGRLQDLAQQVADYINANFAPEQPLDLVGLSMGGIVSRYYLQRLGGIKRVQRFITLGSPHNGTLLAYCSQRLGCVQMRLDSELLQDLNADAAMLEQLNFTSIWTPYDLMIVPAKSSEMPMAKNVQLPILSHAWLTTDPKGIKAVAEALTAPIKHPSQVIARG
ncbi:MAG: alpha/beta fold hydrolase [Nostocaceae cyanobacterium]|nr:alpha/beta fold hydrolase [Nostocaceae cyanobacterium]